MIEKSSTISYLLDEHLPKEEGEEDEEDEGTEDDSNNDNQVGLL